MKSDYDVGPKASASDGSKMSFWVTAIEVDPKLRNGWQRLPQAGLNRIGISDWGTRFGTPESVAKRTWPTLVLVPQRVPNGYRLSDVASTSFDGMKTSHKTKMRLVYLSYHPRKHHWITTSVDATVQRVMVRYRRGFSTFVIDIRPRGSRKAVPSAALVDGAEVTLTAGYLDGRQARTSISPNFGKGPTLVTQSDRSTITITGDLTRQELIDVANSLKAYGDVDRPLPAGYGE